MWDHDTEDVRQCLKNAINGDNRAKRLLSVHWETPNNNPYVEDNNYIDIKAISSGA